MTLIFVGTSELAFYNVWEPLRYLPSISILSTKKKFWILVDEDDEGFNLIQPSLIQQLKTILDQYPDDGQILKVRNVEGLKCLSPRSW